jgi:flagellar FliL protein
MSSEPEKTEKPADAAVKPKTSKAVMALLVLNLAASGFGVFKLLTTSHHAEAATHEDKHPEPVPTAEVVGPILPLDPFVVNLDEPGNSRYLKLTIQLELWKGGDAEKAIEKSKQVIRDVILSHLSGLKLADCLGAAAKDTLRTALMGKLEAIIGPNKVRRMFFQEFVVQ